MQTASGCIAVPRFVMTVGSQRNERGQDMSRKRRPDPWEVTDKVFALLTQLAASFM
jgi:hypothetical protein